MQGCGRCITPGEMCWRMPTRAEKCRLGRWLVFLGLGGGGIDDGICESQWNISRGIVCSDISYEIPCCYPDQRDVERRKFFVTDLLA